MATDPYANITRLPSGAIVPFAAPGTTYSFGGKPDSDTATGMRVAPNALRVDDAFLQADPNLAAYQTKFSQAENLGDGTYRIRMQQPGGHKYDLMDVFYKLDPATGEYVMQGEPTKFKQQSSMTSGLQTIGKAATPLVAAMSGGTLAGALGGGILGGAGAGAILGAGGALLGGSDSEGALKAGITGGAIGGISGGISDYVSANQLSPMEVPSAEWQNIPTDGIDAALARPLPQLDSAISGGISQLTPAALESAIGTPGYGVNASADAYLEGIGSPNLSGANATVPPEYLNSGNWNASGTLPDTPIDPTQTIDINGGAAPTAPAPTTPTGLPQADYSHEGNNYPTPEATQGPGGSPVNASPAAPGLGSKIGDFLKANPRLAISLLGSVFGGAGGGSGGAGGPGSQAGMTATQAPKFQRQYVAPPAGYRPGFDPEHKYFTGIGNTSTGG